MLIPMLRRPWTKKRGEEEAEKEKEETVVVPSLSKSRGLIREALKISPWIFPNFMTSSPFRLSNIGRYKIRNKIPLLFILFDNPCGAIFKATFEGFSREMGMTWVQILGTQV